MRRGTRDAWVKANQGRYICGCGCGGEIPLKPEHFNVGAPRYLHGHNPGPAKPPKPRLPCGCGCGEFATPGRRYIVGHNAIGQRLSPEHRAKIAVSQTGEANPRYGKRASNYKERLVAGGYVLLHVDGHPFANPKGLLQEHRLIVEGHLRLAAPGSPFLVRVDGVAYLRPEIDVHHINEITDDNRVENLQPMTKAEHMAIHRDALVRSRWPDR